MGLTYHWGGHLGCSAADCLHSLGDLDSYSMLASRLLYLHMHPCTLTGCRNGHANSAGYQVLKDIEPSTGSCDRQCPDQS